MPPDIDFGNGGYKGDAIESLFRAITTQQMEYWWHFREVLRANQAAVDYWQDGSGARLPDEAQKELVGLSLLHYGVVTSLSESMLFHNDLSQVFRGPRPGVVEAFTARRHWKALYSSLYGAFNALSNIVFVCLTGKPVLGDNPSKVWNYTPAGAVKQAQGKGETDIHAALTRCQSRLEIRDHLDHYWLIWHQVTPQGLFVDEDFEKGRIVLDPAREVTGLDDAGALARRHIDETMADFNVIYRRCSTRNGVLDAYLSNQGWQVDYSDLGQPHNGARPMP